MTEVGIDTSVLIDLRDPKDVWHDAATALEDSLQAQEAEIAVFNCMVAAVIRTIPPRIHRADELLGHGGRLKGMATPDDELWKRMPSSAYHLLHILPAWDLSAIAPSLTALKRDFDQESRNLA